MEPLDKPTANYHGWQEDYDELERLVESRFDHLDSDAHQRRIEELSHKLYPSNHFSGVEADYDTAWNELSWHQRCGITVLGFLIWLALLPGLAAAHACYSITRQKIHYGTAESLMLFPVVMVLSACAWGALMVLGLTILSGSS